MALLGGASKVSTILLMLEGDLEGAGVVFEACRGPVE